MSVQPFKQMPSSADAVKADADQRAVHTRVTLTNKTDEVQLLPEVDLTVRYGTLGREATAQQGKGGAGLPDKDEDTRIKPGATFRADVAFIVPKEADGQVATVTSEVTEEGLAEAEALFFEGDLPGTKVVGDDATEPAGATEKVTPLGSWYDDRLRLSEVDLRGKAGQQWKGVLELTVANNSDEPTTGMGIDLQFMTGDGLSPAATVTAGLDYNDAPVAPRRRATVQVEFGLPSDSVPGVVTVEAREGDGNRIVFDGALSG